MRENGKTDVNILTLLKIAILSVQRVSISIPLLLLTSVTVSSVSISFPVFSDYFNKYKMINLLLYEYIIWMY